VFRLPLHAPTLCACLPLLPWAWRLHKTPPTFLCDTSNGVHRLAGSLLARLSGLGLVGLSLLQMQQGRGEQGLGGGGVWQPLAPAPVAASLLVLPPAGTEWLQQGSCHNLPCGRGAVGGGTQQQCRGGGLATRVRWVH
jgi:hypothetical protein